ncbi:MAG: hypothetical protein WAK93_15795 [Solirubrobacteraceae bacterium]
MISELLVALIALAAALALSAQLSDAATKNDLTTRAHACAAGKTLTARLTAADVGYLGKFVPCVVRSERSSFGRAYSRGARLSRLVEAALGRFVNLSYLTRNDPKAAARASKRAPAAMAHKVCRRAGEARYISTFADTVPPPVLTPLAVARIVARPFRYPHGVARAPRTIFGIAFRRGALFRNHDRDGAAFGVVAITCPA